MLNGAAGSVLAIFLPPFLTEYLPPDEYGIWALALQLAGYINLFSFGLQVALSRQIAYEQQSHGSGRVGQVLGTATSLLFISSIAAVLTIEALLPFLTHLIPSIPGSLEGQAISVIRFVGYSVALGLPILGIQGYFMGIQRNDIASLSNIGAKIATVLLVIASVGNKPNLIDLARCYAIGHGFSYCVTAAVFIMSYLRRAPIWPSFHKATAITLLRFSSPLVVWQFSTILIVTITVPIVARYDFAHTAHYAFALSIVTALTGVHAAIIGPMIQIGAAYYGESKIEELSTVVFRLCQLSAILIIFLALPLIVFPSEFLSFWLAKSYVPETSSLLGLLLLGTIARLLPAPYALALLATGEHKKILITPLAIGATNFLLCVLGGKLFGAMGVAIAYFLTSILELLAHLFFNMPKTKSFVVDSKQIAIEAFIAPIIAATTIGLVFYFLTAPHFSSAWEVYVLLAMALVIIAWGMNRARLQLNNIR